MSEQHDSDLLLAVVGKPVLHSRSPQIFQAASQKSGRRLQYLRLGVSSANEAVGLLDSLALTGINVTSPYKQEMLTLVTPCHAPAQQIGAINTVLAAKGETKGYNTDWQGVLGALAENNFSASGKNCVVLGAGGAGRAAVYALKQVKAKITLVNRSAQKAHMVACRLGCDWVEQNHKVSVLPQADLIISCLPAGINPLDKTSFSNKPLVMDANYTESELCNMAQTQGCSVINGWAWLVHQALASFQIFTGKQASRQDLDTTELPTRWPRETTNIALIGFPGSGKSTIAKLLANRLDKSLCDTDQQIQKHTGSDIPTIFQNKGEDEFRRLEHTMIQQVSQTENTVFALGGGAVLSQANRELISNNSIVIWLWTSWRTALSRIKAGTRPILAHLDQPLQAKELLTQRLPLYAACADLVLDTTKKAPYEVADRICHEIRQIQTD